MPAEQGRRQPVHHFGGFLGLALHRAKSKSSEYLHSISEKKLDKRVHSSKDLTSGGVGFESVLAELNQQPKFRKSQKEESEREQSQSGTPQKRYTCDTVPFSVKYSVATQSTPSKQAMNANVSPASTQQSQGSRNGEPYTLDQTLHNIRMKLSEMRIERTNMETRIWDLEDGLETAYYQYRIHYPDSRPLPYFPAITQYSTSVENADEVDGYQGESSSQPSNMGSPLASVAPLPANPQPQIQHRGKRSMTTSKHTWQPPTPDMVSSPSPTTTSPQVSPSSSTGSPGSPYGATHHFLNTTPPSSPQKLQPSSPSSVPRPPSHTGLSLSQPTLTSTPNRGHPHARLPPSPPRAHALSRSANRQGSLKSRNIFSSMFSSPQLVKPRGRRHQDETQLGYRKSLPANLITKLESDTSSANDMIINTAKRKISFQQPDALRKRSSSSGNFGQRPPKSPLVKKTSVDDWESKVKRDSTWYHDF